MSLGVATTPPQDLDSAFTWMQGQRQAGAPMSCYTSLRVGGPAELLLAPADLGELQEIRAWAATHSVPVTWLGNGSNLLVRSGGIRGIVVLLRDALNDLAPLPSLGRPRRGDAVRLRIGAGVSLRRVIHLAIRQGLEGLAFAVGIPGTLGGAIVMNAGTEVGSIWDVVDSATLLSPDGRIVEVRPADIRVGYRFADLPPQSVVLDATLRAVQGSPAQVRERLRSLYRRRRESQPLSYPNAGSIFKNPPGERAGRLIEQAGLKGFRIGDAQVSTTHANFIVNLGKASADQVLSLIDLVKSRVRCHTGLILEEEVRIVGE
jgi:UDP-N-acetylmuramate dehydrogenase